jgi:hypothetical protein
MPQQTRAESERDGGGGGGERDRQTEREGQRQRLELDGSVCCGASSAVWRTAMAHAIIAPLQVSLAGKGRFLPPAGPRRLWLSRLLRAWTPLANLTEREQDMVC